jgi:hypothetical protein
MKKYESGIDFNIINFYGIDYIKVLIDSIHKYTDLDYTIYIINNGDNKSIESDYQKLVDEYKEDSRIVILKGEDQDKEVKAEEGAIHRCKIDGRMVSEGSMVKVLAQQKSWKAGNREYICSIDYDAIFLNNWTEELLPLLSENIFVSYFRYDLNIARDQFMIMKRENLEKYNLYPNLDYMDTSGNITYTCNKLKLNYKILLDSFSSRQLRNQHVLDLANGEQIHSPSLKPIVYHFGRGGSRDVSYKQLWLEKAKQYLNLN